MPKELNKTIHFFEAYADIYQEPTEDTLQTDTTRTDSIGIQQDTTFQAPPEETGDTLEQQDTSEATMEAEQTVSPDSTTIDSLVTEEDSVKETEISQQRQAQQQPPVSRETPDTLSDLYSMFGVTELPISSQLYSDPAYHNFLYNIPFVKPADSQQIQAVYKPAKKSLSATEKTKTEQIKELPIPRTHNGDYDWVTYILIATFLLIGWTRLFFFRYFVSLMKSFHSYNYASSLYYGQNSLTIRASFLLNLTFFLTAGTFLFQCMNYYEVSIPSLNPLAQFLVFSTFFLAWHIWNYLSTGFIGIVFLRQKSFQEYFHNYNLYRKILGVSLFPVIIVLQYISPEYKPLIMVFGMVIFGFLYFTHILRGLLIFIKKNVSIFYLILYLCALEFLPLLILYKVFIRGL
ncbi:MAG: DUF4271 domain-containing protein [Bacteroidales bacterium]